MFFFLLSPYRFIIKKKKHRVVYILSLYRAIIVKKAELSIELILSFFLLLWKYGFYRWEIALSSLCFIGVNLEIVLIVGLCADIKRVHYDVEACM